MYKNGTYLKSTTDERIMSLGNDPDRLGKKRRKDWKSLQLMESKAEIGNLTDLTDLSLCFFRSAERPLHPYCIINAAARQLMLRFCLQMRSLLIDPARFFVRCPALA